MPPLTSSLHLNVLLAISALHFALAGPVHAQRIRGQLLEEGSGQPIEGAFVVLLDATGAEIAGVLSDDAGRFVVRAPTRGLYRLRADRIGYRNTYSDTLALELGQTLDYRMMVPMEVIQLVGITATAESRCDVHPAEGEQTAQVWEEARKALRATRWTEQQGLFSFQTERYRRTLDSRTLVVLEEQKESGWRRSGKPFETLPANELLEDGFVRSSSAGELYYAPDAEVLLSDAFLDAHCFGLQAGKDERAGLVGLAFRPLSGRDVADVEGVLWLDGESAELRDLQYRYTGLPFELQTAMLFGGRLEFERLSTGAWIIRRWWIRGPLRETAGGYSRRAIQEEGGAVIRMLPNTSGR
ncbi:MAG: carboxypeptidase regulatory-like domain-containing protein [Gemmatimonadota bacterium]|nr:MAG: carboxypeptidase regulatory-like domain-containing protein [Gemmatimonadota bacterium]